MDNLLYAEIPNEIPVKQETVIYLSSLYGSEDKEGVLYLLRALERHPENSWQMALHKGC